MLIVGIPKETKSHEKRVGLTPNGVRYLKKAGIRVLVEKDAGRESDFSDQDYKDSGADVLKQATSLYQQSGLIQKVKEPLRPEWKFFKPELVIFSFLHLASPESRELTDVLMKRKVTAFGFETVVKDGRAIFLEPMSEIAGTLAACFAGFIKQYVQVSEGKIGYPLRFLEKLEMLAAQYPASPESLYPGKAFIFGGGVVGRKAAEAILKMGGEVDLVEKNQAKRLTLKTEFGSFKRRFRVHLPEDDLKQALRDSDIWVGAVHILGQRAPEMMSYNELDELSRANAKKKLIMDVAVDQGGNFPGTHTTTYEDPLYLDSFGNLRFGVANIPSLCGRGASEAIEKVTLPYLLSLAKDWRKAIEEFPELKSGLQVVGGRLVNEAIARSHGMKFEP